LCSRAGSIGRELTKELQLPGPLLVLSSHAGSLPPLQMGCPKHVLALLVPRAAPGPDSFTWVPSALFTTPMTLSPFPKQPQGFAPLRERHSVTTWCLLKYLLSPALNAVSLLPPSLEDLYIVQNATINCLVSGMETPGSLEVSWSRASEGPLAVVSREPVLQEDGTYSATSILRVCVEEWQSGEEFTCTVKHQDIPSAIVKTIRKSHSKNSAFPL
uniref:Ig-like domain-containing protein n=1 Tax=Chrysemys picta bellii TaxID=8478 RepID=A0A8C3ITE0_CHRPI